VIRVYQKADGKAARYAFEFWPAYVRTWSPADRLMGAAWSLMARFVLR
jgi:hypothetical protein